jgi:PAS domain S-box-containing protein
MGIARLYSPLPDPPPDNLEFLKAIVNAIADPIFVKDHEHRWVVLNDACCEFIGATREELIGKSDFDFFPKSQAETFWETDRIVFESGRVNENEEQFTDHYGTAHTICTRKSRYRDRDGSLYLVGTIRDITGQKEAEAQRLNLMLEQRARSEAEQQKQLLQESADRLHAILEALPVGVFVLGPDGLVIESNVEAERIWKGKIPHFSEISEHSLYQGWRPDSGAPLRREDWAGVTAIRQGHAVLGEIVDIRKLNGTLGTILISAVPLHDRSGNISGAVVSNTDITQLKQMESELRLAKEAAEASSRVKSEFMDIAAHELRTPLTPLMILIENGIRQATQNKPVPVDHLRRALKQIIRLRSLVNDLLDASRLDHGTLTLRVVDSELNQIARECASEAQSRVTSRVVRFHTTVDPLPIRMDPDRIYHLLSNLLDNALKYTPDESPIEVRVSLDKNSARVEVVDHGEGLSPEVQARLFTRFFRADAEKTLRHPGLGLGLFICSRIAALHEGTIGVKSNPGEGSTFYFTLPLNGPSAPSKV